MEKTIRAFVAFKLPDDIIRRAASLQDALKAHGLKMRWVKPQNLHLTLKFLGDIAQNDAPMIGSAVEKAFAAQSPLQMTLQGMGVFPGIKRPRVLWIGFGGQLEDLKQVHRKLEDQLEQIGYERDKRGFRAHLTIARIKGAVSTDKLQGAIQEVGRFEPMAFIARQVALYQSDLRPQGAIYTVLAEKTLE